MIDYVRGEDYESTTDGPQTAAASSRLLSVDGELLERGSHQDGEESREWNGGLRPWKGAKVGMAVIFNKAPLEGGVATWDYTLRFNYTYGVSMFEDQVGGVALLRQGVRRIRIVACQLAPRRCRPSFGNEGMVECTTFLFSFIETLANFIRLGAALGSVFSAVVFRVGGAGGKARTH